MKMEPLKFAPLNSAIHPGFWTALAKIKLEVAGLNEEPIDAWGCFTNSDPPGAGMQPRLGVEWNAFDKSSPTGWNQFPLSGRITVRNTLDSFKQQDKGEFLRLEGERLWQFISSGQWWENPEKLARFAVLMYADLKKYLFYYWFAFPAFNLPSGVVVASTQPLSEVLPAEQQETLIESFKKFKSSHEESSVYTVVTSSAEDEIIFHPLSSYKRLLSSSEFKFLHVCVADPATLATHPGWTLRNLVAAMCATDHNLVNDMSVLCLRMSVKEGVVGAGHSLVMRLKAEEHELKQLPGVVGWEKNDKGQLGPRLANMRSSMDPAKLAENSVDLNLKLMKWRLVPEIDLGKMSGAKCLLLGAGTLGCGVARGLLGWGVRHITFLDNSKVSYSNPVRQSLFTFQDCLNGGRPKAPAAAERLKEIFPGVTTEGVELSVPMPGHPVAPSLEGGIRKDFARLQQLIQDHNVIFLLMDSRESRWLPTIMAAAEPGKLVINAALGFDTFVVMRHGVRGEEQMSPVTSSSDSLTSSSLCSGTDLGCYFCNDVVAPADSTRDRSMDQQCTVTRPGTSGTAAALAVELAASCLQHPQGAAAPALTKPDQSDPASESVLGYVPHSIRGSLWGFNQFLPTGPAFTQCTACSDKVIQIYKEEGFELVKKVGDSPKYLEDLTGLTNLLNDSSIMDNIIDLSDDDSISLCSE